MKVLVSACLLGVPCRYDGRSAPCQNVVDLGGKLELVPVCPEQLGGLETPRVPAERRGKAVVTKDGRSVTKEYALGAEKTLELAKKHGCKKAILKERSPSCGCGQIYDGSFSGRLVNGDGITAQLLKKVGIDVVGESAVEKLFREKE